MKVHGRWTWLGDMQICGRALLVAVLGMLWNGGLVLYLSDRVERGTFRRRAAEGACSSHATGTAGARAHSSPPSHWHGRGWHNLLSLPLISLLFSHFIPRVQLQRHSFSPRPFHHASLSRVRTHPLTRTVSDDDSRLVPRRPRAGRAGLSPSFDSLGSRAECPPGTREAGDAAGDGRSEG